MGASQYRIIFTTRPTWLAQAHARLDAAVRAAYGRPADLRAAILERLPALNTARAWASNPRPLPGAGRG